MGEIWSLFLVPVFPLGFWINWNLFREKIWIISLEITDIYIFRWSGTYCTFTSSNIGVTLLYSAFILVAHFPPHSKQQALPWSGSFSWTKSELLHQHHSSHRDLLPVLWSCTWFAAAPSQCEVWLLSGWHLLSRKYCWYNHESKMRGPITVDNAAFLF